jgi:uncharacterized protein
MHANVIPISALFIGLNILIAFTLSYIVVMERLSTRVWHGESKEDVALQPDYLKNPTLWVTFIEKYRQQPNVRTLHC